MFHRIGKKIKVFAKTLFWIGVCISGILGIFIGAKGDSFLAFLLFVAVGVLVSYLSVVVLYMLGQLVDNSDTMVENSYRQITLLEDINKAISNLSENGTNDTKAVNAGSSAAVDAADTAEQTDECFSEAEVPTEELATEAETPAPEAAKSAAEEDESEDPEFVTEAEAATTEPVTEPIEAVPEAEVSDVTPEPEADAEPAQEIQAVPSLPVKNCKMCGFELTDDIYCPNCGSKISEQEEPKKPDGLCPRCGFSRAFGKFCPKCGLKLRT